MPKQLNSLSVLTCDTPFGVSSSRTSGGLQTARRLQRHRVQFGKPAARSESASCFVESSGHARLCYRRYHSLRFFGDLREVARRQACLPAH
jgi:hypothetical protein